MREIIFEVSSSEDGLSARAFLNRRGVSKRAAMLLKTGGGLTRNGGLLRTIDRVYAGERIMVRVPEEKCGFEPNFGLFAPIVYDDEDAVVFDKPAGLAVHPSAGHYSDTLGNYFAVKFPDAVFRAINRLDKDTTGLCLCAKNALAAPVLPKGFDKTYYAVISGIIEQPGVIDLPIGRVSDSIIKREVRNDGEPSVTRYRPVLYENGQTLLEIKLNTGRTHQIRVHFSHIGYPLLGDELYGGDCSKIGRQALHCGKISFIKPFTDERIYLESRFPDDMKSLFSSVEAVYKS
ncbi:MAG: RluA family pseudouridine synthase [Oscillospiraceae bacterium]|nr:RluA family pseudouridine synthase [Oscillospiraceae bacterium]